MISLTYFFCDKGFQYSHSANKYVAFLLQYMQIFVCITFRCLVENSGNSHFSCSQLAGIRSVNVALNISISWTVCACLYNYRCAVLPKLSLEKGMGMTPGYNHHLRLRNTLRSSYPRNSCNSRVMYRLRECCSIRA